MQVRGRVGTSVHSEEEMSTVRVPLFKSSH